ncbi:leucine--tRNA ligase [Nonlabens sp. MB-3u-79]|uniref:leucine--tRNA ligase n=1 Tax=Nonlabens sp. MB-3u-79 TaxID=2058134 RepID=UPI001E348607|nr:class I tRNA ligase family protein [Nonlabens sp. MB-3u-79]
MLLYDHKAIEAKWQMHWATHKTFKAVNNSDKPKFYALDMFPYPSGAGLHVGHPLGYIASDIVSRYKRHTGFNVLHPMGYDSFGLPAEQYAIQTGQHPAETTKTNIEGGTDKSGNKIAGYRKQMDRIGFSFDWDREVRTSSPDYYKYTQEIFILLFDSWYDKDADKAILISELESRFRESGTNNINAATDEDLRDFTAAEWNAFTDQEQQEVLLDYRLTFLANTEVNWCPALGTVLANDEIVNGVSERGGHPVVRKKMRQWMMRISAFAERLLNDLEGLDWSESIKEIQRNWIGKSVGAMVSFPLESKHNENFSLWGNAAGNGAKIDVFTTRPDTIYGVTFMTLAPEHELVDIITTPEQKEAIETYKKATAARSERERMADVKTISGVFTGAYATHPLSGESVPVWIGDYVLAGYGTGAVMAVPCGDERDHAFANFFAGQQGMPAIKNIFDGIDISKEAYTPKDKTPICNSDFLNGMSYKSGAMAAAIEKLEEIGAGKGKTNYRLRDAVFSRQRYWGEPFPVYYKDGLPQMIDRKHLPLELPEVDEYLPTEDGAPPLGRATHWHWDEKNNCVVANPSLTLPEGKGISEKTSVSDGKSKVLPAEKNLRRESNSTPGYFTAKPEIASTLLQLAQEMRNNPTEAEAVLWKELKGKKTGFKFREQHPIDEFIPDFVCLSRKLIVELEGKYHEFQVDKDDQRTLKLEQKLGYKVIRFTNEEVINDTKAVLLKISELIKQRPEFFKNEDEVLPSRKDLGWDQHMYPLELNTMPGWAGSSWYMFRYMDAHNEKEMFSSEAQEYWENVDLYIGGSEHATGHLLYSRFWIKLLHDLGKVTVKEPFKKMINQGMILGESAFLNYLEIGYEDGEGDFHQLNCQIIIDTSFAKELDEKAAVSSLHSNLKLHIIEVTDLFKELNGITDQFDLIYKKYKSSHLDVNYVGLDNTVNVKNIPSDERYQWIQGADYYDGNEIVPNDRIAVLREVEKMSKSKYNVVSPDDICEQYGADTLRLYEMFLGPLEQAKPWNTAGITGVYGFIKKLWKLYHNDAGFSVSDEKASPDSMKILHKAIKKTQEDIENFSFNTSVSSFMIAVNELTAQKCNSREVLEPLAILVSPYAPHIAEELWSLLGHKESISEAPFPIFDEKYLVESSKTYPISFNGKMKFTLDLPVAISKDELEKMVLANEKVQEQLEGKQIRKTIIVPGKIVNFVVG